MSGADIAVSDHLRSTDPDDDSIYRVVGTTAERVTLLRVSDGDGRRVNSGDVVTVARDALSSFEPAPNPDGNRSVGARLVLALRSVYWSFRTVLGSLAANPVPSLVALALVVAGSAGASRLSGPLSTGLFFAGLFTLVYIGSGRF